MCVYVCEPLWIIPTQQVQAYHFSLCGLKKNVVGEGDSGVKKNSGMRLNERVGTVGTRKPSKQ